jgi:hypothetical protein
MAEDVATDAPAGVPSSVPKLPNEITLGEISLLNATVSDWDYLILPRRRELLNRSALFARKAGVRVGRTRQPARNQGGWIRSRCFNRGRS